MEPKRVKFLLENGKQYSDVNASPAALGKQVKGQSPYPGNGLLLVKSFLTSEADFSTTQHLPVYSKLNTTGLSLCSTAQLNLFLKAWHVFLDSFWVKQHIEMCRARTETGLSAPSLKTTKKARTQALYEQEAIEEGRFGHTLNRNIHQLENLNTYSIKIEKLNWKPLQLNAMLFFSLGIHWNQKNNIADAKSYQSVFITINTVLWVVIFYWSRLKLVSLGFFYYS